MKGAGMLTGSATINLVTARLFLTKLQQSITTENVRTVIKIIPPEEEVK